MDPSTYSERKSRQLLEERLESIISAAALMADADCTRDERRERIVAECNAVRQALQDLLSQYMANVSTFETDPYNFSFLNYIFKIYQLLLAKAKRLVNIRLICLLFGSNPIC